MEGALESVSFCDEIVVVDGGSTDRTVEIARERGARVIENPWPGFAAQRNVALDAATCEWVLELDADERVSPHLRANIESLLSSPPQDIAIAVCPERHSFLGRLLGPSAKYPAYRSRIFKRGAYRHDESRGVHEGLEPLERPAILEGDLEHALARTMSEAVHDAWRYAQLESAHLSRPSNPAAYLKSILLRPTAKVLYRTVVDQGWRDGWQGSVKIFLDASSDALVWTRVLVGTTGSSPAPSDGAGTAQSSIVAPSATEHAGDGHFGRRPAGQSKVVALAGRGRSAQSARRWLSQLQDRGLDVTLISDDATPGGDIASLALRSLRPFATMRALDLEMQVRTIHAVVPFGRRARLVWRLLPRTLRPEILGLDEGSDPTASRLCVDDRAIT